MELHVCVYNDMYLTFIFTFHCKWIRLEITTYSYWIKIIYTVPSQIMRDAMRDGIL